MQTRTMRTALLVVVSTLGVLAGCSTVSTPSTRPAATPPTTSALKPINQAALQSMVDTTAREMLVPGALVLLRTPQGEFTVAYGTRLLGSTSPPRADAHFRIASNTKTITAAVILQLAQEGRLSLDNPISKYVRGVPNGDHITIAELLEMRSGLYKYTEQQTANTLFVKVLDQIYLVSPLAPPPSPTASP
jgi:CubicO group peptidase (beta-lactamase class C family)